MFQLLWGTGLLVCTEMFRNIPLFQLLKEITGSTDKQITPMQNFFLNRPSLKYLLYIYI